MPFTPHTHIEISLYDRIITKTTMSNKFFKKKIISAPFYTK